MRFGISVVVLLLMVAGPPIAWGQVEGFYLVDETGEIDAEAVEAAAEPLLARQAKVAVFVVTDDGDVTMYLDEEGLMIGGTIIDPLVVALFVEAESGEAQILTGSRWEFEFRNYIGGIQDDTLQAMAADGDLNGAMTSALIEIEAHLSGEIVSDTTTVITFTQPQEASARWLLYLSLGILVILGIATVMTVVEMRFYQNA